MFYKPDEGRRYTVQQNYACYTIIVLPPAMCYSCNRVACYAAMYRCACSRPSWSDAAAVERAYQLNSKGRMWRRGAVVERRTCDQEVVWS